MDAIRPMRLCDGLSRRTFLHVGTLVPFGLSLAGWFAGTAKAKEKARDANCILLFLLGGPSQIDTWDPKPEAPVDVRGPYRPIATRVPGLRFTELFPLTAQQADKLSLVRSVYSSQNSLVHTFGAQLVQTGRLVVNGVEHPHVGCSLGYLKGPRGQLPPHVILPKPLSNTGGNVYQGQAAGYLGKQHDPFVLDGDPSDPNFRVRDLLPPEYLEAVRVDRRRSMREAVDDSIRALEEAAPAGQVDRHFERAFAMLASPQARGAFTLDAEPAPLRQRYGGTRFGQSCLLARRLIERGVRFVTVNMYDSVLGINWDIHGSRPFSDFTQMETIVAPDFDRAFSALVEDLDQRGMLSTTLVIAMGEFGRTPAINPAGGRDHHVGVWTVLAGGGPFSRGRVVGESDRNGERPKSCPVSAAQLVATFYRGLGLDPHQELPGPRNRPIPLVDYDVEPVSELL
jgi:uncharacterized protein (DUF1501 family)